METAEQSDNLNAKPSLCTQADDTGIPEGCVAGRLPRNNGPLLEGVQTKALMKMVAGGIQATGAWLIAQRGYALVHVVEAN